jgi:hypothetical protein
MGMSPPIGMEAMTQKPGISIKTKRVRQAQ